MKIDESKINELELKIRALKKFIIENKTDKVNTIVDSLSNIFLANELINWDNSLVISLFEIITPKKASELLYEFNSKQTTKLIQSLSLTEIKIIFEEVSMKLLIFWKINQNE